MALYYIIAFLLLFCWQSVKLLNFTGAVLNKNEVQSLEMKFFAKSAV